MMKELSVFVDESGDYGDFCAHSPYYIVTLVFHDQSERISSNIILLDQAIEPLDLPYKTIHMGPIIRREKEYQNYPRDVRIKAFRRLLAFAQKTPFTYQTFVIEKKQIDDRIAWNMRLSKKISAFIKDNIQYFLDFDTIKIYYDNGQHELTSIILTVFSTLLNNIDYRNAAPSKYKLLQVADLVCTLELLSIKMKARALSPSELSFFESYRTLNKNYLKIIEKRRFPDK
jgi:hypothetical protein